MRRIQITIVGLRTGQTRGGVLYPTVRIERGRTYVIPKDLAEHLRDQGVVEIKEEESHAGEETRESARGCGEGR